MTSYQDDNDVRSQVKFLDSVISNEQTHAIEKEKYAHSIFEMFIHTKISIEMQCYDWQNPKRVLPYRWTMTVNS
jgi:hypothetical protein